MNSFKALVLPSDTPPPHVAVKRQLLFFDSVLLVDPQSDRAILNRGDLAPERGLKMTMEDGVTRLVDVGYGDAGTYSRSSSYVEAHRVLFAQTSRLQTQGKIRILKALPPNVADPRLNWVTSAQASHDRELVRAALPDYQAGTPAVYRQVGGWYQPPLLLSQTGEEPKQHLWLRNANHFQDPDLDLEWNQVGWMRIGRALKSLRRAAFESAVPVAIDIVNRNICLELGPAASRASSSTYPYPSPSADELAMQAISMDVVDPCALDDALEGLSWDGVIRLRKEVLPHVGRLRRDLVGNVLKTRPSLTSGPNAYQQALKAMNDDHHRHVDDLRNAWRKLGLKTLEVAAGAAIGGKFAAGLHAIGVAWVPALVGLAGAFLGKMVQGSFENVSRAINANSKVRASPLLFVDGLPERVRKLANDEPS